MSKRHNIVVTDKRQIFWEFKIGRAPVIGKTFDAEKILAMVNRRQQKS